MSKITVRKIGARWQPVDSAGHVVRGDVYNADGTGYSTKEGAKEAAEMLRLSQPRGGGGRSHARRRRLPDRYEVVETIDGDWMILIDGIQTGSKRDRSGAGSDTYPTYEAAHEAALELAYPRSHATKKTGASGGLTAAQQAYVTLFEKDVREHPAAYKADVRADPAQHALRVIEGLDDDDVRQVTRDLREEMRLVARHHATKRARPGSPSTFVASIRLAGAPAPMQSREFKHREEAKRWLDQQREIADRRGWSGYKFELTPR